MRVAVIGASGQLGSDIVTEFGRKHDVVPLGHDEIEVTNADSVMSAIDAAGPDVVINCAATHRVHDLETQAAHAFDVNALGPLFVARACEQRGAACVFVSTDYVFDGSKNSPYDEDDVPAPLNVYGTSKVAGEQLTLQSCEKAYVVRVSSLFGVTGPRGKGKNFIENIIGRALAGEPLTVVTDVTMSPTYTRDAAALLSRVLSSLDPGVYHLSNRGACSWHDLASRIVRRLGLDVEVAPTTSSSFPAVARVPVNSSLTSVRLSADMEPRPWEEALDAYLTETGRISS
jgi:dTDP-4-dehydrorhamnose reductase